MQSPGFRQIRGDPHIPRKLRRLDLAVERALLRDPREHPDHLAGLLAVARPAAEHAPDLDHLPFKESRILDHVFDPARAAAIFAIAIPSSAAVSPPFRGVSRAPPRHGEQHPRDIKQEFRRNIADFTRRIVFRFGVFAGGDIVLR